MRHSPELMTSMSAEALLQVYDDEICKMSHVLFLFLAKSGDLKTRFYTIYLFFFFPKHFMNWMYPLTVLQIMQHWEALCY